MTNRELAEVFKRQVEDLKQHFDKHAEHVEKNTDELWKRVTEHEKTLTIHHGKHERMDQKLGLWAGFVTAVTSLVSFAVSKLSGH